MKDFIIFWLVFQLVLIGWGMATINNKILDGTVKCPKTQKISRFTSMVFPLVYLINYPEDLTEKLNEICGEYYEYDTP